MPRNPRRPCRAKGCAALAVEGECYCALHLRQFLQRQKRRYDPEENKYYEKYKRDPDTRKRYDSTWERIRNHYRNEHPLCEQCLKEGRYTPTEHVHHIKPLAEGGTNDTSNLMALCKSCHSRIHALMKTQKGKNQNGERRHNERRSAYWLREEEANTNNDTSDRSTYKF